MTTRTYHDYLFLDSEFSFGILDLIDAFEGSDSVDQNGSVDWS
jgi:hypothetical protein